MDVDLMDQISKLKDLDKDLDELAIWNQTMNVRKMLKVCSDVSLYDSKVKHYKIYIEKWMQDTLVKNVK